MAGEEFKMSRSIFVVYLLSCLIGLSVCIETNRLEILPTAAIQYKPIGKPLMLTCRPIVVDLNLVSDLQWRDNENMTILPKPSRYYYPMYDSKGQVIPSPTGQTMSPMYTETLPGDQSLALIIPSLKETMAGKYFCSASYAGNQLMEIGVTITTYIAITWKDAPENQFPILGNDYIVRCEVTAIPSPTIDWLRNGDQIKNSDRHRVLDNGLEIRNVQESDDGTYTCRAAVVQTGELGERNIRVEVYTKPQIVHLKPTLEAVEGQSFSTQCNATGKPVPEIIWIKDKTQQNVETADRFLVNAQTGTLTITKVEQDDYGTYTCRAKNQAGEVDQKTKLDVLVLPKIFEFYNRTGQVQKEIALTCRAHGRPAPEITFKRWGSDQEFVARNQPDDDRIYLEQLADNEKGESTGILRISKAMRSDDGLYQCVARNKGHTAYKVGHITVEYPPDFTYMKTLPPVFSWEERDANLSCLAEGFPNATIEWRWNGRNIKELMDPNLRVEGLGPRSNLIVKPVDKRYYSVYKCLASNNLGKAEHDMQLKEGRVPGPVDQARIKVLTATSITFDILGPPTERGLPIAAYRVQYKEEYNRDWSTALSREWSPESDYTVEGLRPQTKYQFRFAARNHVGIGPWSGNIEQTTPRRSAPEEPKTLHSPVQEDEDAPVVVSPYSDHFELRWSVPADNGEPIDYYQVRYCPGHKINGEWSELGNECITNEVVESTSYEMSHLSANTYYRIELKAHNAIGYSTPSSIMMKTARGLDVVLRVDKPVLSSAAIVGIAIGGVLILLVIIDFLCCVTLRMGVIASMCRKAKRSPSEIDEETKLGSLYGWRFPLPYCSGQLVKEPPPSPLPLPPPVKLGGSPMASPMDEKVPLNTPTGSIKKNSSVEFDGKFVHSRSGDIIGKNSAV